jgi:hypothetical protein
LRKNFGGGALVRGTSKLLPGLLRYQYPAVSFQWWCRDLMLPTIGSGFGFSLIFLQEWAHSRCTWNIRSTRGVFDIPQKTKSNRALA